jgi:methyl-accepting chemotaxis protein
VRALAQRCAAAAKETAVKIDDASGKSHQGVIISREVKESFDAIQKQIHRVDAIVAEIATASTEQSQGIDQVSTAVAQMDQVTQSNASSAEETASASEELSAQSVVMRNSVGKLLDLIGGKAAHSAEDDPVAESETHAAQVNVAKSKQSPRGKALASIR